MSHRIAFAISLILAASPALSQSPQTPEDLLRHYVMRDAEQTRERMINQLFAMAPSGELTRDMANTIDQRMAARTRNSFVISLLENDLNGDGDISALEISKVRKVLSGNQRSNLETNLVKIDANQDGALSADEITQGAEAFATEREQRQRIRDLQGANFMIFDFDGDGVVVVDDILKTIERIADETSDSAATTQGTSTGSCALPKPSENAVAVFVGGYEGSAISTVAVAGRDRETSFATLEIEEGDTPLYIVMSVYDAMVVHVVGATDRVERFVGGSHSRVGVVGLPEDVVDLTSVNNCRIQPAYKTNSSDGIKVSAVLSAKLGREVRMVGQYDISRSKLPSGDSVASSKAQREPGGLIIQKGSRRFQMTEDGVKELESSGTIRGLEATLYRFYPGGLESVMPEDVVTNGKAEAYDVLPQQAGLMQLVRSGAVSILADGTFSIDKPIARFPAGLNGAHSVKFVLRRGVPMPAGSPGHSSVLIEETGKCHGARC